MTTIHPTRVLAEGILISGPPLSTGLARVYRGLDLGPRRDDLHAASGPAAGAPSKLGDTPRPPAGGPYRAPPPEQPLPGPAPVPVIVRELGEVGRDDPEVQRMFARATLARHRMRGSPAPRLLHVLGHGDGVLASVEEHLRGTPLELVLHGSRDAAEPLPVPVVLAIGRGLVSLWSHAAKAGVRTLIDPTDVVLDPMGDVRAIPTYVEERARPEVGAALIAISTLLAYSNPERIVGRPPDPRGAMYVLGLILYRMIAGAHPFETAGAGAFDLMSRMAESEAPPLRDRRDGLHPALTALVHRCLSRDPSERFASWHDLSRAYAAIQALFPPAGAAEILALVQRLVPAHPTIDPRPVALPAWQILGLPVARYRPVPLPEARPEDDPEPNRPDPAADPEAVYGGTDGRPMYRALGALRIDARPVTRAEIERFFLMTGAPRPPHLPPLGASSDDDPCVLVPAFVAEAYARWAGKRLPTEAEWQAAVHALGPARLGAGEIWEWTSTPHPDGGFVVRGGRWRDVPDAPPDPANRSFATSPAPDLGFRCVA
jgi:hypothetical protein